MDVLADVLPSDVLDVVHQHLAASVIQRTWCRWSYYSHARRSEWKYVVRTSISDTGVRMRLARFADVRKEWRRYASCWAESKPEDVACILQEAEVDGLWGWRTSRY